MRNKIGIVGTGLVGATAAYTLALSGLASELVLVDLDEKRAYGEALDIGHGMPLLPPAQVVSGGYEQLEDAHLVIVAAGANQKPGETRMDLTQKNLRVMDQVIPQIVRYAPDCVIVVVTNPVDVLTMRAIEVAGFAPGRVFGSGTVLDTARLRALLARHAQVDPRNVHAYVIGEHGDSEVPAWSLTNIAGMSMEEYCQDCGDCAGQLPALAGSMFDEQVRGAAYSIIDKKGATYYAVAVAIRRIAEAVLRDERAILTVSTWLRGECDLQDVCLSLPCIVGVNGIERVLPVNLAPEEKRLLHQSAKIIREQYVNQKEPLRVQ